MLRAHGAQMRPSVPCQVVDAVSRPSPAVARCERRAVVRRAMAEARACAGMVASCRPAGRAK